MKLCCCITAVVWRDKTIAFVRTAYSISVKFAEDYYILQRHLCYRSNNYESHILQQEGSLCAQHCLNNLLQGEYFTPVDLSSIAHQLDEEERMRMAEGGIASEEYRTFLQVN